jgi:hypothetical protein
MSGYCSAVCRSESQRKEAVRAARAQGNSGCAGGGSYPVEVTKWRKFRSGDSCVEVCHSSQGRSRYGRTSTPRVKARRESLPFRTGTRPDRPTKSVAPSRPATQIGFLRNSPPGFRPHSLGICCSRYRAWPAGLARLQRALPDRCWPLEIEQSRRRRSRPFAESRE